MGIKKRAFFTKRKTFTSKLGNGYLKTEKPFWKTVILSFFFKTGNDWFETEQFLEKSSHFEFYSITGEWLPQNVVAFQDYDQMPDWNWFLGEKIPGKKN